MYVIRTICIPMVITLRYIKCAVRYILENVRRFVVFLRFTIEQKLRGMSDRHRGKTQSYMVIAAVGRKIENSS